MTPATKGMPLEAMNVQLMREHLGNTSPRKRLGIGLLTAPRLYRRANRMTQDAGVRICTRIPQIETKRIVVEPCSIVSDARKRYPSRAMS